MCVRTETCGCLWVVQCSDGELSHSLCERPDFLGTCNLMHRIPYSQRVHLHYLPLLARLRRRGYRKVDDDTSHIVGDAQEVMGEPNPFYPQNGLCKTKQVVDSMQYAKHEEGKQMARYSETELMNELDSIGMLITDGLYKRIADRLMYFHDTHQYLSFKDGRRWRRTRRQFELMRVRVLALLQKSVVSFKNAHRAPARRRTRHSVPTRAECPQILTLGHRY